MANENVIFKKGLSTSLPEEITPGALLVETDTGKIYLDDQSELIVTLSDVKVDAITYRLSTETSGSLTGILQERYFTEGNFPTELGQIYYQTAINQFLKVVMLDPGEDAQLIYLDSAPIADTSPQQYRLVEQDRIELSYENIFYNAIAQDSTQLLPTPGNYADIPRTRIRADAVPQSSEKHIVYSLYIQSVTTETGYFYGLFTGELLSKDSDTIRITCLSYLTNTCYIGDSVPQPTITKQQGSLYFNTTTHIFYVYSLVEAGTYQWVPINIVDQTYNPESENAQSGTAVKEAIESVLGNGNHVHVGNLITVSGNAFHEGTQLASMGTLPSEIKVNDIYINYENSGIFKIDGISDSNYSFTCLGKLGNNCLVGTTTPSTLNMVEGQFFYNTVTDTLQVFNGFSWDTINKPVDSNYNATSSNAQSGKAVAQALEQNIEELSKSLPYKLTGQTKLEQFVQKYQLKQNKYIDLSFLANWEEKGEPDDSGMTTVIPTIIHVPHYFTDLTTAVTAINSGNFDSALADETGANIVVFDGYDFYVIRMLNDITTNVALTIYKDFIFDFNGKTLTYENGTALFLYSTSLGVLSEKPSYAVIYGMKESSRFISKGTSTACFVAAGKNMFDFVAIGGEYKINRENMTSAAPAGCIIFYFYHSTDTVSIENLKHEFYYLNFEINDTTAYSSLGTAPYSAIGINGYAPETSEISRYVKLKDIFVTGNVPNASVEGIYIGFINPNTCFVDAENIYINYNADSSLMITQSTLTSLTDSELYYLGLRLLCIFRLQNSSLKVKIPTIKQFVQVRGWAANFVGWGVIKNNIFDGNWDGFAVNNMGETYDISVPPILIQDVVSSSPDHGGCYITSGKVYLDNCTMVRQYISGYQNGGYGSSYFRNYDTSKELNVYINNSKFIGAYPAIAVSYDSNNTPNNPYGTNVYVSNTEMYNNQCRVDNNNTLYVGNNVGTITNTVTSNPGTITTTTEDYPYVEPVLPSIPDVILGEQLLDPITVGNFSDMLYGRSYAYLQDNYKYIVDLFSKVIEAQGIDNLFEVGDLVVDDGALK